MLHNFWILFFTIPSIREHDILLFRNFTYCQFTLAPCPTLLILTNPKAQTMFNTATHLLNTNNSLTAKPIIFRNFSKHTGSLINKPKI